MGERERIREIERWGVLILIRVKGQFAHKPPKFVIMQNNPNK